MPTTQAQREQDEEPSGYLTEDLWFRISEHMTTQEWCKTAGTCKASNNVQLKWIRLTRYLPLEAWAFILKRSAKAVGFEVDFDPDGTGDEQARLLTKHICGASSAYQDMKELRVCGRNGRPIAEKMKESAQVFYHMALASMALAFKSLQVLHLACDELLLVPSFQSVRHLLVEQPDFKSVVEALPTLQFLETLSLYNTDVFSGCQSECALDCRAHTRLQHVHLKNFVPSQYHLRAGCKIHGSWSPIDGDYDGDFLSWTGSALWLEKAVSSIHIEHSHAVLEPQGELWAALTPILSTGRILDRLDLEFQQIGSADNPFPGHWLASTKYLRLEGICGCHIVMAKDAPLAWKGVCITSLSSEASMDIMGDTGFLRELELFYVMSKSLPGETCMQLAHALGSLGKEMISDGSQTRWWLSSYQKGAIEPPRIQFELIMLCGCQACLSCLQRLGKLLEGSKCLRRSEGTYSIPCDVYGP